MIVSKTKAVLIVLSNCLLAPLVALVELPWLVYKCIQGCIHGVSPLEVPSSFIAGFLAGVDMNVRFLQTCDLDEFDLDNIYKD